MTTRTRPTTGELLGYAHDDGRRDPDPIAAAALDLLVLEALKALKALKGRPVRESEPEPVVTADLGCEPPF